MPLKQDIFNHNMILPDMASISECFDLEKMPDNPPKKIKRLVENLKMTMESRNKVAFRSEAWSLNIETLKMFEYTKEERAIQENQYNVISKMSSQYISDLVRKEKAIKSLTSIDISEPYLNLCTNGYYSTNLDRRTKKRLKSILSPHIKDLRSNPDSDHSTPGSGYDRHRTFKKGSNDDLMKILDNFYRKNDLYKAAERYYACGSLRIKSATLHVCSPSDTHFYQTLRDCSTTSSLIGMHFDPKAVMKTIIYLNDVCEDSGPFSVVPTTNRWHFDHVEKVFAKGNSIGNYLNSPSHRRVAMRMPKELRKNAIFGRFVPDGTSLSEKLLSAEKIFVSDECDFILFDPANTFHRGGICKSKQRVNLQIILTTK